MNILKRIYCRVFQTGFRAALIFLPYRKPEVLDSTQDITPVLKEKGLCSVLIVTDSAVRGLGLTKPLELSLESHGIHAAVFDQTVANPTTDIIAQAVQMYQNENCQALIGFGGGSPIDCAKAVGAQIARPNKTLGQMAGILKVHHSIPLLFAVPTTAGTGSETTLAAVVTDSKTRHKYAINDFPLIPGYAVLDPEMTRSLPPHLTATTGMDALTHAIEAYIGRSTTIKTRKWARKAVRIIFSNLEICYKDGNDMRARRNMANAAFLAGNAFTQSYVGYVHAVAHSLGGKYNVPHGEANAILLPYVLESYGSVIHKKLHRLADEAGLTTPDMSHQEAAERFIAEIRAMNQRMGIGTAIPGIQEEDIPMMARHADREANPLYPVPVLKNAKELQEYYYMVMEPERSTTL